jgi:YfiH family protein
MKRDMKAGNLTVLFPYVPNSSFITFRIFEACTNLICAFSTRHGGISQGLYHSLNLGFNCGDTTGNVTRNRNLFFKLVGITERQTATGGQVHGSTIQEIDHPGFYPKTDGLVCREKGIFLAVQTADCFPLMLCIPERGIVACIHCGWRGVAAGVVENALQVCAAITPQTCAVIGPGIQSCCFEVEADVFKQFPEIYATPHPDPQKRYLDLQRIIRDKLVAAGLHTKNIYSDCSCTCCALNTYYSYRRDGKNSGRMLAVIGMR